METELIGEVMVDFWNRNSDVSIANYLYLVLIDSYEYARHLNGFMLFAQLCMHKGEIYRISVGL